MYGTATGTGCCWVWDVISDWSMHRYEGAASHFTILGESEAEQCGTVCSGEWELTCAAGCSYPDESAVAAERVEGEEHDGGRDGSVVLRSGKADQCTIVSDPEDIGRRRCAG